MAETIAPPLKTDLTKDGGGFLCLELVPKSSLGQLARKGGLRFEHAHLAVAVTCAPVNLPAGKVPCRVRWTLGPKGAAAKEAEGIMADLEVSSKTVIPLLELTSDKAREARIGALLESGGTMTLTVTPDTPYTEPSTLAVAWEDSIELSLTLSWTKETGKKLGALASKPELSLGEEVQLTLKRGGWRCPVRFRVSSVQDDATHFESIIDFGTSGERAVWRVGYDNGVLRLPAPSKTNGLVFTLELQVSDDDGTSFAPILSKVVEVPRPKLKSLAVRVGQGLERALGVKSMDYLAWQEAMKGDRSIRVVGELEGVASRFDAPFAVELWGYNSSAATMHPLYSHRTALGRAKDGRFEAVLTEIVNPEDLSALDAVMPFAILRAQLADPLIPLPTALDHALRRFGDEDFTQKAPGLGICSQEIGPQVRASRQPLLMRAYWEISPAGRLVLGCSVCGPANEWQGAKFVVGTRGTSSNPRALVRETSYAPVAGSSRGVISTSFAFSELGPIADCEVVATVETAKRVQAVPQGGQTATFLATPSLGPVWWRKNSAKQTIHFLCSTNFFPRDATNRVLEVKLFSPAPVEPGRNDGQMWVDETQYLGFPTPKPSVDADGKLEAFIKDPTAVARLEPLLQAGRVKMKVAVPGGGKPLVIGGATFAVKPWEDWVRA